MTITRTITVGADSSARQVTLLERPGGTPSLFWLGGYRSEMTGTKAEALDRLGEARGWAVTRFDYSGHGASGGDYRDGSISRWLEEAQAVFTLTHGPQVVIGSSMGGWLALLLNRALRSTGDTRIKALVLVAPAVDMTEDLMLAGFTRKQRKALETEGFVAQPNDYGNPHIIPKAFIDDGRQHLMFGKPIETGCPVTVLQGGRDRDVPKAHALKLVQHILSDPVSFTLIPEGDHRLSRDEDIRVLERAVVAAVEGDGG